MKNKLQYVCYEAHSDTYGNDEVANIVETEHNYRKTNNDQPSKS